MNDHKCYLSVPCLIYRHVLVGRCFLFFIFFQLLPGSKPFPTLLKDFCQQFFVVAMFPHTDVGIGFKVVRQMKEFGVTVQVSVSNIKVESNRDKFATFVKPTHQFPPNFYRRCSFVRNTLFRAREGQRNIFNYFKISVIKVYPPNFHCQFDFA